MWIQFWFDWNKIWVQNHSIWQNWGFFAFTEKILWWRPLFSIFVLCKVFQCVQGWLVSPKIFGKQYMKVAFSQFNFRIIKETPYQERSHQNSCWKKIFSGNMLAQYSSNSLLSWAMLSALSKSFRYDKFMRRTR